MKPCFYCTATAKGIYMYRGNGYHWTCEGCQEALAEYDQYCLEECGRLGVDANG